MKAFGMTLNLKDDRLFMYLEASDDFDLHRDFPRYAETQVAKEWDDLMRINQEPVDEAKPDEWWAAMEEVFDLNLDNSWSTGSLADFETTDQSKNQITLPRTDGHLQISNLSELGHENCSAPR